MEGGESISLVQLVQKGKCHPTVAASNPVFGNACHTFSNMFLFQNNTVDYKTKCSRL